MPVRSAPSVPRPPSGSQASLTEKITIIISPSQKPGIA